jgi:hypothetical protein
VLPPGVPLARTPSQQDQAGPTILVVLQRGPACRYDSSWQQLQEQQRLGGYVCSNELGPLPDPRTVLASLAPGEGAKRHFTELLLKLAANRQVLDVPLGQAGAHAGAAAGPAGALQRVLLLPNPPDRPVQLVVVQHRAAARAAQDAGRPAEARGAEQHRVWARLGRAISKSSAAKRCRSPPHGLVEGAGGPARAQLLEGQANSDSFMTADSGACSPAAGHRSAQSHAPYSPTAQPYSPTAQPYSPTAQPPAAATRTGPSWAAAGGGR